MASRSAATHPWHPTFVHFPIACWVLATVADATVALIGSPLRLSGTPLSELAGLLLWTGTIAAVPTIALGVVDYLRLGSRLQHSPSLGSHMAWMGCALALYLVSGVFRAESGVIGVLALESGGLLCLLVGGRAAARIVYAEMTGCAVVSAVHVGAIDEGRER